MNIKEAKEEIIRTVRAYLAKDETGSFLIPRERQRPVLLMGAPGIGKTAVMRQIAEELNISLVSYTITHHTRQSAVGLPVTDKKYYGGREYTVTEYTMSEIVASVYDQIERSGIEEGILFLDEINCVSETLAPTMLQFLQYKTFGSHRVPDGYVIVTAGNPPEYNKSVRDLDIVTLDRVKRLDVKEDFGVWKEYALKAGIHGAVLSYLEIKKDRFYSVRADINGKRFVTARAWEDLSDSLKVYERLGLPVEEAFTASFLQDPETAEDFFLYYGLWQKYRELYRIPEILDGHAPERAAKLQNAPFDEKLSLIGLLTAALGQEFRDWAEDLEVQRNLFAVLKKLREEIAAGCVGEVSGWLGAVQAEKRDRLEAAKEAHLLSRNEEKLRKKLLLRLKAYGEALNESGAADVRGAYGVLKTRFAEEEKARQAAVQTAGSHLTNAFAFLNRVFGEGQEMVLFLSELDAGYYSMRFVKENGNDAYYQYNKLLLLKDRQEELRQEVMRLL